MAKLLTIDEMVLCLREIDFDQADRFARTFETLATELGEAIATQLGVSCGEGIFDEGGVMVAFAPKNENDPCPAALEPFDQSADWD
jgi:hypothetical protein